MASEAGQFQERCKSYVCNLCDKAFCRRDGLDIHIRAAHTRERPFACTHPGCHKKYTCGKHLSGHAKTHLQIVNQFNCTHCGKSFANQPRLTVHNRSHTDERPFACTHDGCGMSFRTKMHLNGHFRTHTKDRPYGCTFCPYRSAVAGNLREHVRIHTGEKPFKCTDCGAAFALNGYLAKHTARLHMPNTSCRRHKCSVCPKMYISAHYLKTHERTQHSVNNNSEVNLLKCAICEEVFSNNMSFRAHKKNVHLSKKSFPCDFCGKVFRTKADSLEHLQRHIGEKPFSCARAACGKSFGKLSHLRRHEKTHQIRRERPYTCDWCYKSYHEKGKLKVHSIKCKSRPDPEYRKRVLEKVQQNRETGEHPFFCEVCATSLSSKGHLKRHMTIHGLDSARPYECKKCEKHYFDRYELKQHLEKSKTCGRGIKQPEISNGDYCHKAPNVTNSTSLMKKEAVMFCELRVALPYFTYDMI